MKILMIGATGLVGLPLCRALNKAGHELLIASRRPQKLREIMPFDHLGLAWPLSQADEAALSEVDAVIHLLGESVASGRWSSAKKASILNSRVEGVRQVWQALKRAGAKPKVWLNASAVGFYGDRGDESLSESSDMGKGFLAETCKAWETEVFSPDFPEDESVRKVCLRIGLVLSTQGGALAKMLPAFRWGLGGRLGHGQQWMSWIHVDDLVNLFVWALEQSDLSGPINAVSPQAKRNVTFSQDLAAACGRWLGPPAPALALKLALGEMSELLLSSQKVVPTRAMDLGFSFEHEDLSQALKQLLKL